MIRATYKDRKLVSNILASSFNLNKSINYIIPVSKNKHKRIQKFMEYSFDIGYYFGEIYLSDNRKGCAIIVDNKKNVRRFIISTLLDIKLVFTCVGLSYSQIKRVLYLENAINKIHPATPFYHLFYIGVTPSDQHKGIGTSLLKEIIKKSVIEHKPLYLETSTLSNLSWYKNHGFEIFTKLVLTYDLYFLKRTIDEL
jgi:hypothetical protein